jgi:UDP-N-acetylglucosamine--N-acetylmuramyl-(pentapeptide) pyrophosphoryl-undecaprenol N-acetylglucosamine transferase
MDLAYRAADLVVSRAGASTISELQIVGAPAVLIPSPNVAEDHQRKNAEALANIDAAEMILDCNCADRLADTVVNLLHDANRRNQLAANIRKMALTDADEAIFNEIQKLTQH